MNQVTKRIIFWAPRILCLLFALFLSLFALDAFNEEHGFWENVLGFFIHLIPVYIVILFSILAWKWEWIGALVFMALALFYAFQVWGREHWSALVIISGPLLVIGILYGINWIFKSQLREK